MSDKLSELLPCPFCGGAVVLEQTIDKRHWWGVKCRNTLNLGGTCAIEQIPSASPEAAVERWNRRVSPAPAISADRWQPIETAPKETELLGWREDCGVLLIMHTSFDRWASEAECDDIDEETLFQKDWFGTALPGIMDRLEREQVPTHWMPLPVDPTDDALKAAPAISESEDARDAARYRLILSDVPDDDRMDLAMSIAFDRQVEVFKVQDETPEAILDRVIDAARKENQS
ncbi:Lar family restriction alleviation protein [Burkholderia glumae]|uniref:Lar family restriction alleviation protein n=1 Tax=Burkholderia glumae TaxID=337 RepID=UPI0005BB3825|nr:Lar family restriction alleviation protein [Burkholderia glumae]